MKGPHSLLIGAHTSAAGGVHNALLHGKQIGATTIQLFTANQRQWKSSLISEEELLLWKKTLPETNLSSIMSHSSYLVNLGSPDKELLEKSRHAFAQEIRRCHQLDLAFLNFHPGAATHGTKENCIATIIQSLLELSPLIHEGKTRLLLETTAGQGTCVGASFEELALIIQPLADTIPIGVCIDTCHIFSAGYDIRTEETFDETFKKFDKIIGLEHLYALHVNDSLKPFAERKDRHACLGKGEIGEKAFKLLMKDKRTAQLPKYLETPDPDLWKEEIEQLRSFAKGE